MKSAPKATATILLEKRVKRKDNTFPVKLRITHNRERRYYTVKNKKGNTIALTIDDYSKIIGERPRGDFKDLKVFLNDLEKRAGDTIEKLSFFSFEAFERKYFGASGDEQDLFSGMKGVAERLRAEGRVSTAITYECALNSIKKYVEKPTLSYDKIDAHFLNSYENWMLQKGNSITTIGIYLRNVRTMYKAAEKNGVVKPEQYPFGKDKYQTPSGRNIKKALTQSDVGLIASYAAIEGTSEHRYRDYWLFSYLCNGINVKDMARLKYGNITGDIIAFVRAKTQRETKQNQRPITIVITKMIGRIIDLWGNKPGIAEQYIFPILEKGLSPQQEYERIQQATKLINEYVKRVAKAVGIAQKVTSYTARHSFATVLKRSGASLEFISESLGHSNLLTTENYLSDFEVDVKKAWAEKLTNF